MTETHDERRFSWRVIFGAPAAVWLLCALQGLLLLNYSIVIPAWQGRDEPHHVDMIFAARDLGSYPAWNERVMDRRVAASLPQTVRPYGMSAAEAPTRSQRPSLEELAPGGGPSVVRNRAPQHPPAYYLLMAGISAPVWSLVLSSPFDAGITLLRWLNIPLVALLPLFAFAAARHLTKSFSMAVAAACVPLAIPQLAHIGSSVNNDNLLTFLFAVVTVLLAYVFRGDTSTRTAISVGVTGALALLTKGFALVLPVWIVAAYAGAARYERSRAIKAGRLALGLTSVVGGAWWLMNLLFSGTVQPGYQINPPAFESFSPDPLWWVGEFVTKLSETFWGGFGLYLFDLPRALIAAATVVLLAGILLSFGARRREWKRRNSVMLVVPALALLGLLAVGALAGYLRTGVAGALQGRYLFPAIPALAIAAVVGWARLLGEHRRRLPLLVLVAAGVMHLFAGRIILAAYYGPDGAAVADDMRALFAWAAVPAGVLLATWGLLALAGLASVFLLRPSRLRA